MEAQNTPPTVGKKKRGALVACAILFAAYFINVIVGKVNISYGLKLPHLGNVAEFLLLFISSVSLIVAALKSEAAEKQPSTQTRGELKNGK